MAMKSNALCVALTSAWLGLQLAHAAPPSAEAFFKDPAIVEAVLSPSGRKLAVTSSFGGGRISLGVFDLSPNGKPTRAAQFTDSDIWQINWVNDERLLFSLVDLSEGYARGAPGLFAVNPDGSEMRQLVRRSGITSGGLPSRDRLLDFNHRLLTVPWPQPGEINEEVLLAEISLDELARETPLWLN